MGTMVHLLMKDVVEKNVKEEVQNKFDNDV